MTETALGEFFQLTLEITLFVTDDMPVGVAVSNALDEFRDKAPDTASGVYACENDAVVRWRTNAPK